mmetsp:Transcript_28921/g.40022  ORF Transcript_28921/g.40022 Transcript_28921/m.40022 type:complete len:138 (-) Transcript_28921:27-440(-)
MIILQNDLSCPVKVVFYVSGSDSTKEAPIYNKIKFIFPPNHIANINTKCHTPGRHTSGDVRVKIKYFNDCILAIFKCKRGSKIKIQEKICYIEHEEDGRIKYSNLVSFEKMKSTLGFPEALFEQEGKQGKEKGKEEE